MLSNHNATGGNGQEDALSINPALRSRDGRYKTYTRVLSDAALAKRGGLFKGPNGGDGDR